MRNKNEKHFRATKGAVTFSLNISIIIKNTFSLPSKINLKVDKTGFGFFPVYTVLKTDQLVQIFPASLGDFTMHV